MQTAKDTKDKGAAQLVVDKHNEKIAKVTAASEEKARVKALSPTSLAAYKAEKKIASEEKKIATTAKKKETKDAEDAKLAAARQLLSI